MASLPLTDGCQARFEAIDPTTGNAVTGVKIVNPSIYGIDLTGNEGPASVGLVPVAPLWLPEPLGTEEPGG
jgi:hypothetical protein